MILFVCLFIGLPPHLLGFVELVCMGLLSSMLADWLLLCCQMEIPIPLLSNHLLVLSWLTEVICIEKFSVLVKIFQLTGLFRRDF